MSGNSAKQPVSGVFKVGAVSLAFLILGYQAALFVHKASVERLAANRDHPDTVFVIDRSLAEEILSGTGFSPGAIPQNRPASPDPTKAEPEPDSLVPPHGAPEKSCTSLGDATEPGAAMGYGGYTRTEEGDLLVRKSSPHPYAARRVESFRFDPNTVSVADLMRLGFSEKQAQSIENYRDKGGRFRRKGDFAKSFVVSDSVYRRLEPFIDIPKIDINRADSAAFDSLPGIGGWFARQMVDYRQRLHGYSCTEQLMEIYRFDQEKYDGLKDLITCSSAEPYPFWSLPADSLRLHPHVRSWQTARAIVFYREHNPPDKWTADGLLAAGIITEEQAAKLNKCTLK
mgnify:FL=1